MSESPTNGTHREKIGGAFGEISENAGVYREINDTQASMYCYVMGFSPSCNDSNKKRQWRKLII